ncbi:galactose-3-O-sulfotransferase 2-like [Gastrophryne carolinensis]
MEHVPNAYVGQVKCPLEVFWFSVQPQDIIEPSEESKVFGTHFPGIEVIESRSCQPHTHICFLKTHKTASSTIMNILFRFGESHNLTFALPSNNAPQFMYPLYFNAAFVEGFITKTIPNFDIMCHHMRFHLGEVEKVMPKDTFYFTILRNPVFLMESSYAYYKAVDIFKNAYNLEQFILNPHKFYDKSNEYSHYGKNFMTFDLGFDHNGVKSTKSIELIQKSVEAMFDLVLITEYFDESLILLKEALCWSFDDVLSLPLNIRSGDNGSVLSVEIKERIKTWNHLDWQLYVYFNNTFWEKVHKFGKERMQLELKELQRRRALQSEICIQGLVDPNSIQDKSLKPFQAGIDKIMGYNLKPGLEEPERSLCQRLVTPELPYSEMLLNKQTRLIASNVYKRHKNMRDTNVQNPEKHQSCPCPRFYVGETKNVLKSRIQSHLSNIRLASRDLEKVCPFIGKISPHFLFDHQRKAVHETDYMAVFRTSMW